MRRDWGERLLWIGDYYCKRQNYNIWGVFFNELDTDVTECRKKVVSGKKTGGDFRSLVNARGLHPQCARALHEALIVPVLFYGSETMIWTEKEKSKIRTVRWTTSEVCWVLGKRRECQMC